MLEYRESSALDRILRGGVKGERGAPERDRETPEEGEKVVWWERAVLSSKAPLGTDPSGMHGIVALGCGCCVEAQSRRGTAAL